MASDVAVDEFANYKHNLSGDIFMSSGIMSPRELYLTDLPQCTDILTDHSQYKCASSSDSGISTVDDLHDVANVTDLNSLLDTDFKEFDFSLDFVIPKNEHDDVFDSGMILKSERESPFSFSTLQVSSDFYLPGDIIIKEEEGALSLPAYHHCDPLSPASSSYSPQQNYTIETLYEPLSPSQLHTLSPQLPSQSLQAGHSCSAYPATLPYIQKSLLQNSSIPPENPNRTGSPRHASPSPPPTPNYIVVPNIKQETQISILSPPGQILVQAGGDVKPFVPATFNIDAILNSKIKIQPKPGSEIVISKGSSQWVTTTTSSQQTLPVITSVKSTGSLTTFTDEKTFKRAQRIIKNRESASLSRRRKKEYLTSLEERLQQCRDENERLLRENDTLRQQVEYLQKENSGLKHQNMSPAKKICLMCLAFLLALNISPFSILNGLGSTGSQPSYHVTGRHLMSVEDDGTYSPSSYDSLNNEGVWSPSMLLQFNEELRLLAEKLNITGRLSAMCPMYFNSTESDRLAEQLKRWMISQEEEKKKKEEKRDKKKKSYPSIKQFRADTSRVNTKSAASGDVVQGNSYPVQVFNGGYYSRQKLLSAIPHRNDTFYVLSFSTDYFLLPATAHNKTMRPRMSLLMPVLAPSVNESSDHDSIGVMQIDCEIFSTNLIQLDRSAFSQETFTNSSFGGREDNQNSNVDRGDNKTVHSKPPKQNSSRKMDENIKYWEKLRRTTSG